MDGHSTQDLSWATVNFTAKCTVGPEYGGKQLREDAIKDDMVLAADEAVRLESHRFVNASQNGNHADKRSYTWSLNNGELSTELVADFDLRRSISSETLVAIMYEVIGPAVSIAIGSHFGKNKGSQGSRRLPSVAATLVDIEDQLAGAGSRSRGSRRTAIR